MPHIQQNLNYRSARSTRLLNNHIKDNFGQQKSVVLFGFNVSPTTGTATNQINIGPGAILTHGGQKIFAYDSVVTTVNVQPDTSTARVAMYVVVMKHNYVADTSVNEPTFDAIRVKDWTPRDIEPVKDIREMNIITGNVSVDSPTLYHSQFNTITEGYNIGDFSSLVYGQDTVLGWDQIPIAKIIINFDTWSGNIVVSGAWGPGVGVYQYKNPFEQLADYLGVNYFEPGDSKTTGGIAYNERWEDSSIDPGSSDNNPFNGISFINDANSIGADHNYNRPGHFVTAGENRTPVKNPLYGYYSTGSLNKALYAYASFLDDGHSLKWSLQRLSEVLRAVESIVGSHPEFSVLLQTQNLAPKDISHAVASISIRCDYNVDPNECFVINSGNVGWYKPSIGDASTYAASHDYEALGTFGLGDNHHTAIAMIDKAMSYMWHNRLGLVGSVSGTGIDKQSLRTFSVNASSLSFDREFWDITSISGDVGQYATFKDVAQSSIDNKLHRYNDIAYGWVHFGTDTGQDRASARALTNYETIQGTPAWITLSGEASSYCDLNPIHIGNKGIFVQKYNSFDIKYGPLSGDFLQFSSNFGVSAFMSDDISDISGVHYPEAITVTTSFKSSKYAGTYSGSLLARSTLVGGDALNLTTKSYYDVEINCNSAFSGSAGSLCTISWNSDYSPSVSGLATATIVSSETSAGSNTTKVRLNSFIDIMPIGSIVAADKFQNQLYVSPWNLLEYTKNATGGNTISGSNIGSSTITLNGTDYAILLNYNEFSPAISDYNDNINVVDRFDGSTIVSFPTKKGSQDFRSIIKSPIQATDWLFFGDDYTPLTYAPSKGSIVGPVVNLKSNQTNISSNKLSILSDSAYFNGDLSLGDTAINSAPGNIYLKSGKLYIGSGCEIIMEAGSSIRLQDGSAIYQSYGSTISTTTGTSKVVISKAPIPSISSIYPFKLDLKGVGTDSALKNMQSSGSLYNHFRLLGDAGNFNTYLSTGPFSTTSVFQQIYDVDWAAYNSAEFHTSPTGIGNYINTSFIWPFDAATSVTPTKLTLNIKPVVQSGPNVLSTPKIVYVDVKLYPFSTELSTNYTWTNVAIPGWVCYISGRDDIMNNLQFISLATAGDTTSLAFLDAIKTKIDPGSGGPAYSDKARIDIARSSGSDNFSNLVIYSSNIKLDYAVNVRP